MSDVQKPAQWSDLITHEEAATELRIGVKRLRGFMFRNGIADPIRDATHVYRGSMDELRRRLEADRAADHSSAAIKDGAL
jgi:hypothetical protein